MYECMTIVALMRIWLLIGKDIVFVLRKPLVNSLWLEMRQNAKTLAFGFLYHIISSLSEVLVKFYYSVV